MKLVRADGHPQQQWALANEYTRIIAQILSEHIDDDIRLIRSVASILREYTGAIYTEKGYEGLNQKVTRIYTFYEIVPDYTSQLLEALRDLYRCPLDRLFGRLEDQINSLRGAVVELLGLALIKPRYNMQFDECANSRRFFDQENAPINLQEVDIAAISFERYQLEGYECKLKMLYFDNTDRIELEYIHKAADKEGYDAHVGIISFDTSSMINRRLDDLEAAHYIQSYGLDNLSALQYSPFE